MNQKVRIGLIGSQFITSIHAEALKACPSAELFAVASPTLDATRPKAFEDLGIEGCLPVGWTRQQTGASGAVAPLACSRMRPASCGLAGREAALPSATQPTNGSVGQGFSPGL